MQCEMIEVLRPHPSAVIGIRLKLKGCFALRESMTSRNVATWSGSTDSQTDTTVPSARSVCNSMRPSPDFNSASTSSFSLSSMSSRREAEMPLQSGNVAEQVSKMRLFSPCGTDVQPGQTRAYAYDLRLRRLRDSSRSTYGAPLM